MRAAQVDTGLNELGLPDEFINHASRGEIMDAIGLNAQTIARDIVAQVLGAKVPHAKPLGDESASAADESLKKLR